MAITASVPPLNLGVVEVNFLKCVDQTFILRRTMQVGRIRPENPLRVLVRGTVDSGKAPDGGGADCRRRGVDPLATARQS